MMTKGHDIRQPGGNPRVGWWQSARTKPVFWIILIAALAVGFLSRGGPDRAPSEIAADDTGHAASAVWTCSMHPQVKLPEAGQCPICFMDLIPLMETGDDDDGPRVLTMSASARQLAQIVTVPVERRLAEATIQMLGRVEYDETRVVHIAARVPGRIDRLYIDYTGMEIRAGDPLVLLYSPRLLAAQEELLQAIETVQKVDGSNLSTVRQTARSTVESARDKLRLWGLTDAQVMEIEARGHPSDQVTIYAPAAGVVVKRSVLEGEYVETGSTICMIADLSQVWLELEAYESDLKWLREGEEVAFTVEAFPGEHFTGQIAFIDPVLDARTRTIRVRVDVRNPDRRLKPGMFARATVTTGIDRTNAASASGPGGKAPLIIPATAPLITGKRAVVYVALPNRERPTFEGRDVILGPRAGDYYVVESGLEEGELVVVNGAFKIDSELQIRAKPSMMSPEGGTPPIHDHAGQNQPVAESKPKKTAPPAKHDRLRGVPSDFAMQLEPIYAAYFDLHRALADDDNAGALSAREKLARRFGDVDSRSLDDSARAVWHQLHERLSSAAGTDVARDDWDALRENFERIAAVVIDIGYHYGHSHTAEYFVTRCPMAFGNRGAYWLQDHETIANPYFGHAMLRCGSVTDRIQPSHEH